MDVEQNPANEFRRKLRALRRYRRLTQVDLAEKSGLSRATVSNLERGIYGASIETLRLLDEALGEKVESFSLSEAS